MRDRLGRFLGQLRIHEGVALNQLAHGLCTLSYLNKVERGAREVGKQLTDAFFQRLGKPVELFERILDWDEFQQWKQRQEIISHLNNGDIVQTRKCAAAYRKTVSDVLNRQFLEMVEINCMDLDGASHQELLPVVNHALRLTQPDFETTPVASLLLSQNEGRLLFAHLQLRETLEGVSSVAGEYRALLQYFKQPRYESRERVYLLPYVALRVIENNYRDGEFSAALSLCEDTLDELTREHRLYGYDRLLAWKQKLFDATGKEDRTPERLLVHLESILRYAPKPAALLIPCEERGNVYCLNQVIRDRRTLLGISQETLSAGICEPHTLSRIENNRSKVQQKNRRALLQKVNMSGERYDYEVVTDRYEDYILRSELDRAVTREDWNSAQLLFETLQKRTPDTPTNRQYFTKKEAIMKHSLIDGHPEKISKEEFAQKLEDAFQITLPLDIKQIDTYPACVLSINEILGLLPLASCYEKLGMYQKCLSIHLFLKRCLECSGTDASLYADLYTRVEIGIASVLGSLGQYEQSSNIIDKCLKLVIQNGHTEILARCLLGKAWNMVHQMEKLPPENRSTDEQKVNTMFRHAYAATIISKDVVRQQSISKYYRRRYGIDISL